MTILITAGGTQEPIDQVRNITNTSTGNTANSIAHYLYDNGYKNIYYVHSKRIKKFDSAKENISFVTSNDLDQSLKEILSHTHIDIIIHLAAVSDFVVDKVVLNGELFEPESISKISSKDNVELVLKKRSKIIDNLKRYALKTTPLVIGFKLTNSLEPEEQLEQVLQLSMNESVDFVVHNDLRSIDENNHRTQIYFREDLVFSGNTKDDLNANLLKLIKTYTFNLQNYRGKNDLMS